MTSIYPQLNSKIQEILESVDKIKEIHAYPATKIDKYPAAIFYPERLENSFETTSDNFKIYGYKLWIVVGANGSTVSQIFNSVMPNVMDAVLEKLDDEWSFTSIGGHRVWCKVETGAWNIVQQNNGLEIIGEINLIIKMLTN